MELLSSLKISINVTLVASYFDTIFLVQLNAFKLFYSQQVNCKTFLFVEDCRYLYLRCCHTKLSISANLQQKLNMLAGALQVTYIMNWWHSVVCNKLKKCQKVAQEVRYSGKQKLKQPIKCSDVDVSTEFTIFFLPFCNNYTTVL